MHSARPMAILLGGIAMVTQIVLLRAFMAIFWGNELLIGFILATWMFFSGLGSWWGNRLTCTGPGRTVPRVLALQAIALAGGVTALLLLPSARTLLEIGVSEYLTIRHLIVLCLGIVPPIALSLGLSFTLLAHSARVEMDNPAAFIYIWDATGSLAGSILFTFFLVHWATPLQILLAAGMVLVAAAMWSLGPKIWQPFAWILLMASLFLAPGLEENRAAAYWRSFAPQMALDLRATSPHGELTVVEWGGVKSLFNNGALQAVLPDPIASQADAAVVMNQPLPYPRHVLLIGGGLGGLAPELARYPGSQVTYIEMDRKAFELAMAALPDTMRSSWQNPGLQIIHTDGRQHLQSKKIRYDLLIINAGRPSGALVNRYYTEEFFTLAKSRLESHGILALLNVPSGENYLGAELLRLNKALFAGLSSLFEKVTVIPGSEAIFLAGSSESLTTDPVILRRNLEEKSLDLEYFFPAMFAFRLSPERISGLEQKLSGESDWHNRDYQPIAYFIDLLLWQKMVHGGGKLLLTLEHLGYARLLLVWSLLLGGAVLLAIRHGQMEIKRRIAGHGSSAEFILAAFSVGMAGIAFDVLFIMAMQNIFGNLYRSIGLALAVFMAGMAGGAWLTLRASHSRQRPLACLLLLVTALLACMVTPFFKFLSVHPSQTLFYAVLFSCSAVVGGLFPLLCALYESQTKGRRLGTINAADLAGGAAGALLIGGLWVPLFGFARTLHLVALTNLAAIIAITAGLRQHNEVFRHG